MNEEYQNTANFFNGNGTIACEKLLQRCEQILDLIKHCPIEAADNNRNNLHKSLNGYHPLSTEFIDSRYTMTNGKCSSILEDDEDISYLDMTTGSRKGKQFNLNRISN